VAGQGRKTNFIDKMITGAASRQPPPQATTTAQSSRAARAQLLQFRRPSTQRGFSRAQAEGVTEALKELDISTLAKRSDLEDLELRLVKWIAGMLLAQGALIVALIQYFKRCA
jgi:hypothetical protein